MVPCPSTPQWVFWSLEPKPHYHLAERSDTPGREGRTRVPTRQRKHLLPAADTGCVCVRETEREREGVTGTARTQGHMWGTLLTPPGRSLQGTTALPRTRPSSLSRSFVHPSFLPGPAPHPPNTRAVPHGVGQASVAVGATGYGRGARKEEEETPNEAISEVLGTW